MWKSRSSIPRFDARLDALDTAADPRAVEAPAADSFVAIAVGNTLNQESEQVASSEHSLSRGIRTSRLKLRTMMGRNSLQIYRHVALEYGRSFGLICTYPILEYPLPLSEMIGAS